MNVTFNFTTKIDVNQTIFFLIKKMSHSYKHYWLTMLPPAALIFLVNISHQNQGRVCGMEPFHVQNWKTSSKFKYQLKVPILRTSLAAKFQ
jgi:hypothetical protein